MLDDKIGCWNLKSKIRTPSMGMIHPIVLHVKKLYFFHNALLPVSETCFTASVNVVGAWEMIKRKVHIDSPNSSLHTPWFCHTGEMGWMLYFFWNDRLPMPETWWIASIYVVGAWEMIRLGFDIDSTNLALHTMVFCLVFFTRWNFHGSSNNFLNLYSHQLKLGAHVDLIVSMLSRW